MRSIAWRYSSMLNTPSRTARAYSELTRTSQASWNGVAPGAVAHPAEALPAAEVVDPVQD